VSNGVFTIDLDFGSSVFTTGANRFLEINVRRNSSETFTMLSPRQQVTAAPYSIRSLSTDTATNSAQLGGLNATQYVQTTDTRLSNARPPTAGSNFYIQNTTTQQTGAGFNISGTGKASIFDAETQYDISGNRVLSASILNTFVGVSTGLNNTSGSANIFIGQSAGRENISGASNTFVGRSSGSSNTEGNLNSFFGSNTGNDNVTGTRNSFFGSSSGTNNVTGQNNAFFGHAAGFSNESGTDNVFIGNFTGFNNVSGSNNTLIGSNAEIESGDLSYATAIGAGSIVGKSNTIVIGRQSGADRVLIFGILPPDAGESSLPICVRSSTGFLAYCTPSNYTNLEEQESEINSLKQETNLLNTEIKNIRTNLIKQERLVEELKFLVCANKLEAGICQKEDYK
jgi:hypothetical protein